MNNSKRSTKRTKKYLIFIMFSFIYIIECGAQDNIRKTIAQSNFIFLGTISKMNASNINVTTNSPTAIVRVDEVVDAVDPYDQMTGKEITVLLMSSQNKKTGDKQVFYTMGWYYGKTLGVKEISNNQVTETVVGLKETIIKERNNIKNDSLRDELKKAVLVVQGIVIESNINIEKSNAFESEHDPQIKKAIIEIKSVLKGKLIEKRVTVNYSSSDDVMWYNSPKLIKGQEGVFLLHLRQAPVIFKIQGYTLLDYRDFQQTDNLSKILNLLKN